MQVASLSKFSQPPWCEPRHGDKDMMKWKRTKHNYICKLRFFTLTVEVEADYTYSKYGKGKKMATFGNSVQQ